MEDEQMSDLAKAILNKERITPTTSTSPIDGVVVPKGSVPIQESARGKCDSAQKIPEGASHVNFSKKKKDK